jgi:hypothetical protein
VNPPRRLTNTRDQRFGQAGSAPPATTSGASLATAAAQPRHALEGGDRLERPAASAILGDRTRAPDRSAPRLSISHDATGESIPPEIRLTTRPAEPTGIPPGPGMRSCSTIAWRESTCTFDPEVGLIEIHALAGALHHARAEALVELARAPGVALVHPPPALAEALERASVDDLVDRVLDVAELGRADLGASEERDSEHAPQPFLHLRSVDVVRQLRQQAPVDPRDPGRPRPERALEVPAQALLEVGAVPPLQPDLRVVDCDLHGRERSQRSRSGFGPSKV